MLYKVLRTRVPYIVCASCITYLPRRRSRLSGKQRESASGSLAVQRLQASEHSERQRVQRTRP